MILSVPLNTHEVETTLFCSDACRARAHEGIENRAVRWRDHTDKVGHELFRFDCGMGVVRTRVALTLRDFRAVKESSRTTY